MTQTLNGTAGNDPITGTDPGNPANPDGIDIINGLDGNDTLSGLGGNDTISGGLGADILDGGAGFDTLSFAAAAAGVWVNINGGAFGGEAVGDTMTGFEAIIGSAFNDIFGGDGGNNTIDGGGGTDIISISGGTDFLDGGAGGDFLDCRTSGSGVIINVATGVGGGGAAGTTFANFESIIATNFNDILTAAAAGSTLGGLGGNDTLNGGDGNDVLLGDDFLNIIGTTGNDSLSGGGGNDFLQGGALGDVMDGGTGSDTASYENSNAGVIVNLSTGITAGGHADGDTLISVENVLGSTFDDLFVASAAANFFDGRAGGDGVTYAGSTAGVLVNLNGGIGQGGWAEGDTYANIEYVAGSNFDDTLYGNGVANSLDGGEGNDVLEGLVGADTLQGGNGSDTAAYAFSAAGVNVNLTTGIGLGGDAGGDTYSSIENVTGSALADAINGDAGANTLNGGAGDDVLQGRGGADALQGGGGIDTATYGNSAGGVTVNLALGTGLGSDAQGDTLTGIENVIGTALADTLIGDGGANVLTGADGDDTIRSAAGNDVVSGGNGNDLINAGAGADAIDGGAGVDTVFYDSSTVGVNVNLANGTGLSGDAQGDTLTGIENLVGSGFNDTLTGDGGANSLAGGDGDDVLHGGAGADALGGGNGVDAVDYTGSAAISVNLLTGTGSGGDAQGDTLTGIENLFGTTFADTLTGNAGANILGAGDGDDLLLGGGGADQLRGGNGTDTASYVGSAVAVQVDLSAGTGTGGDAQGDTLTAIENLIGSSFNDTLTGNAGANDLRGDVGDDVIRGGVGADRIGGGAGVDTADYATSAVGVIIDLAAGTGTGGDAQGDTLFFIENVTGSGVADRLTGDALANGLTGGGGDDTLHGGAGADVIDGGAGIDWGDYLGSSTGVTVNLQSGTGIGGDAQGDTLTGIENLMGSRFADALTGDAGSNHLHDGGFGGADTLTGGGGSDTYSVYNTGATIVETAGQGLDRVNAGVNYVLASGVSAEYLNTTSLHATYSVNLTGNEIGQLVRGNDGANVLDGGGGKDVLFGMGGADSFRFSTALGPGNVDRIADFNAAQDQIQLDDAIFGALGLGALAASAFKDIAFAPKDADDRIIYNSDTGALCYDADGSGTAFGNVRFATLTGSPVLTAADFIVV
jgi:Ca2+-binding RTX toxin-like protein